MVRTKRIDNQIFLQRFNRKMTTSPKCTSMALNILRVTRKPSEAIKFYTKRVGMKLLETVEVPQRGATYYRLGFEDAHFPGKRFTRLNTALEIRHHHSEANARSYHVQCGREDAYWKIGLSLRDVDRGADILRQNNHHVSRASQFEDIGYLCHLSDPANFAIE
eukprot:323150_1